MVLAIALVQYAFVMVLASLIVGGLHRPPGDARAPYLELFSIWLIWPIWPIWPLAGANIEWSYMRGQTA